MLPFFRPDPAWQRRSKQQQQQQGDQAPLPPREVPTTSVSSPSSSDGSPARSTNSNNNNVNATNRKGSGVSLLRRLIPGGSGVGESSSTDSDSPQRQLRSTTSTTDNSAHTPLSTDAVYYDHLPRSASTAGSTSEPSVATNVSGDENRSPEGPFSDMDNMLSNNSNNYSGISAAQLEWLSNGGGDPTAPSRNAGPPPHRGTPPAANSNNNSLPPPPPSSSSLVPMSPSQVGPTFPVVIPPNEVEDETILNSALAEAWFARRREHRMQEMLSYNPLSQHQQLYAATGHSKSTPMMDPRTGGFQQQGGHPTAASEWFQPQQHPSSQQQSYYPQQQQQQQPGAVLLGPVDVDSGVLVEAVPPPTAQAVMLQNPFDTVTTTTSSDAPQKQQQQPAPPPMHFASAYAADNSDSITVISKPNSLASYPSATTSDMTPVVSNVAFPSKYAPSMNSSYAASGSSVAYTNYTSNQMNRRSMHHHEHHEELGQRSGSNSSSIAGGAKGLCGGSCLGSSGADRNSCKGFLDIRTYHGKLAIMLVTILVLAIATMVVSATMTFQTKGSATSAVSLQGDTATQPGSQTTPAPTLSPTPKPNVPTTIKTLAPMTSRPMTQVPPTNAPAPLMTKAPTLRPTNSPTVFPATKSPTQEPVLLPTSQPQPTATPTTASPTTRRPTPAPTPRPTDSLESWILPVVTTITGPDQGSHFGTSVALSSNGKVLAVGAPEHLARRGEVRVYHSSAVQQDQWVPVAILTPTSESDLKETFGFDVALSSDGSILAVGAPGGNGTVYTYALAGEGQQTTYVLIEKIESYHSDASFGYAVALSDDGFRLVAGAPYTSPSTGILNGQVQVYALRGKVWEQLGKDLVGDSNVDWLGSAVDISLDGMMVIASAPRNRAKKGYVRTWRWEGSGTVGNWTQTGPDITNNVAPTFSTDRFGHSIALSQSSDGKPRVAVGSPWKVVDSMRDAGMALVYEFDGTQWNQLGGPITQSPAAFNMENGNAVDLDGGILIVGIPGFNNTGAVALYRYVDGEWQKRSELVEGNRNVGDDFGVSLASRRIPESDGFSLLVGALMTGNNGNGTVTSFVKET